MQDGRSASVSAGVRAARAGGRATSYLLRSARSSRNGPARAALFAAAVTVAAPYHAAFAADGTWNVTPGDGLWQTASNWAGAIVPGGNGGAAGANTDTATLEGDGVTTFTGAIPIAVDLGRNVGSITFNTTVAALRVGEATTGAGNILYLSGGGTVRQVATVAGINGDISAPVVLNGNTYTLLNNGTSGLRVTSTMTAGAAGATTVTLDGSQGVQGSSQTEFNGTLVDDPANGRTLGVIKNGTGTWEFNTNSATPNLYSGDTIINAGVLRTSTATGFNGVGGLSANSHYIVNSGGFLRPGVAGGTMRKLTVKFGGLFAVSTQASHIVNIDSESGAAITFDFGASTTSLELPHAAPISLVGSTADEGGITLIAQPGPTGTGPVSLGGDASPFNSGSVRRVFDIGEGADANDYDLRIRGSVSGTGGLVKKGPGTLRFSSSAGSVQSPMTGTIEIQAGRFNPSVSNIFSNAAGVHILVTGGGFHVQGDQTQTVGSVVVTKGALSGGNNASTIASPTYAFNIGAGDTATVDPVLADSGGPSTLTKTGAGSVTFTGAPSYTGATTVSGGILSLAASLTTSSSLDVSGGTVELRVTAATDRVIRTPAVTVTGAGRIDLKHNRLITATPLGTWGGSAYTAVSGLVDRGRGDGSNAQWDGGGIVTTDSRAVNNNDLVSIGTAKIGTIKGIADTETTTFSGQVVLGSDTVAMVTWGGDANLDGKINILDYGQIDFNVGSSGSVFGWYNGDFNYDGKINILDYGIIDFNVSAQDSVFPTAGGSVGSIEGVAAVPEPSTAACLVAGAMALLRRARRRNGRPNF